MFARIPPDRLNDILDIAEDGIISVDARQEIVLFNRGAAKLFGYEPGEVAGRKLDTLLPERFHPSHRQQFEDFGRSPEPARLMGQRREVYGRRKDGSEFPAEVSISKFVVDGDFLFTAIVRDVSERRRWESERVELDQLRAQAELHVTRAKLDALILAARDGIVMLDGAGRITFINAAAERMFGATGGSAINRSVIDVVGDGYFVPTGSDAVPDPNPIVEVSVVTPNGSVTPLELSRSRVYDYGEVVWLLIVRDLTERRRAEDTLRETTRQLWQAARLAGVGELAASVAHELNNPLGTVALRVEQLLAKTPAEDPRRRSLEVVEGEVNRMADLVGNLLLFSRAGREQVSTVDVTEEIRKTLELVGHHLRKRQIRVEPDFAPSVPPIHADRQHLRQVFLNLFTNAADAMSNGGRLTPRVRPGVLPGDRPAVTIEVADTGVGIPLEFLPRVCEPFFTTKDEGKGTGLGLAICRRIVDQHQGVLEVESQPGVGTTVRVILPVRPDTNVTGLRSA